MLITVPGIIVIDARSSVLHDWMEASTRIVLCDGSQTRAAMGDPSAGISTPDVSLVDTVMADRFPREAIHELGPYIKNDGYHNK